MAERGRAEGIIRCILAEKMPAALVSEATISDGNGYRTIKIKLPDDDESRSQLGRVLREAKKGNPDLSYSIHYPLDDEFLLEGVWKVSFNETP